MEYYGTDQESLLLKVAWYYYEQGMTQQEIGKRLGFSRTKIVRLLATAREKGIVQILSLIHISEPTRPTATSRIPSSA